MLNVPDIIKTLFKMNEVRKNFRVHFPNGEHGDLTNSDVVQESVKFTESVCSQDTFRFGCAESSVIEFETVGIPNMYGMMIECGIEIDTSSLSAAQITAITADPGDGVLVLAADSDLGFGFYRVPFGIFRVESCPRNHGAMMHRQVTAYTIALTDTYSMSPFEKFWTNGVLALLYKPSVQRTSIEALLDANIYWNDPAGLTGRYTNVRENAVYTSQTPAFLGSLSDGTGTLAYSVVWTAGWNKRLSDISSGLYLTSVEKDDFDISAIPPWIETTLGDLGASRFLDALLKEIDFYLHPYITPGNVDMTRPAKERSFSVTMDDLVVFNDSMNNVLSAPSAIRVRLEYTEGTTTTQQNTFTVSASGEPYRVFIYDKNDKTGQYIFRINSTSEDGDSYAYKNAYSFHDIFSEWAEVNGSFVREARDGEVVMSGLSPLSPLPVSPGDYQEAWWDEYNVSPIGTVVAPYNSENADAVAEVMIGTGDSVYGMLDNNLVAAISGDAPTVSQIVNGRFAGNAGGVGFTPVDMTMQGWPWIEAGDALEVTAEDGTIIDTYALRIEMSGIQNLVSVISSPSGEIVGEA